MSDRALWSITGGPPGTKMRGRTLIAEPSPTPLVAYVGARYFPGTGGIISPLVPVTIGPAFKVQISALPPVSSSLTSWTSNATAQVTGGVPPYEAQWRWRTANQPPQPGLGLLASVGVHTDPLRFDSDGDGMDDYLELAAGSDPTDNGATLIVTDILRFGSGVALRWNTVSGKSYRVLRSSGPGFGSFDVIAATLPAAGPVAQYFDTAVNRPATPRSFYRIEVEQGLPASVGDSDGDGATDTEEIALGSDPGRYDTDRDGIGDGEEILVLRSSPVKTDTDGDGSSD